MIVSFLDNEDGGPICIEVDLVPHRRQWIMLATWAPGDGVEISHREWLQHEGRIERATDSEYRAFAEWYAPIDLQDWR